MRPLEIDIIEEAEERRGAIPIRIYYTDDTNKRVRITMFDILPEEVLWLLKLGKNHPEHVEVSIRPYRVGEAHQTYPRRRFARMEPSDPEDHPNDKEISDERCRKQRAERLAR